MVTLPVEDIQNAGVENLIYDVILIEMVVPAGLIKFAREPGHSGFARLGWCGGGVGKQSKINLFFFLFKNLGAMLYNTINDRISCTHVQHPTAIKCPQLYLPYILYIVYITLN